MAGTGTNATSLANLRPWQPGESGARTPEYMSMLMKFVHRARINSEEALDAALEIMRNKAIHPQTRLNAATAIMDRAWGKPKEHVEVSDSNGAAMLRITIVDPNGSEETLTIDAPGADPAKARSKQVAGRPKFAPVIEAESGDDA